MIGNLTSNQKQQILDSYKFLDKQLIRTPYNIFQSLIPQNIYLNPDPIIQLSGQKGLAIYEEMLLDPVISSLVNTRMNRILGLDWTVMSANSSEDSEDMQRAEFIQNAFDRMALKTHTQDAELPGFKRFIKAMMDGIWKGYSGIEAVWALPEGRIAEAIQHVPQTFDFGWADGATASAGDWWTADTLYIRQDAHGAQYKAPNMKIMMFIYDSKYRNPYGASALQKVYWPWWASFMNGFRFWMTFLDKWANPSVVAHVPQNILEDSTMMGTMKDAAVSFQTDFFAAFLSDPNGKEYVKLMEANRSSSTNAFEQFMTMMNAWKALGLIGNVLSVMDSQHNTRAASQTHEHVLSDYTDSDIITVQEWAQIPIQWMIDVKFGKPEWQQVAEKYHKEIDAKDKLMLRSLYPQLKLQSDDKEDLNERAKRDQVLVAMGVPYTVAQAQEVYGIDPPEIDPETKMPQATLQPAPSAPANTAPPNATGGSGSLPPKDNSTEPPAPPMGDFSPTGNSSVMMFGELFKRMTRMEENLKKKSSLKTRTHAWNRTLPKT